ncbi:sulfatase [Tamlana fucoidanivorans]|uniref:Sulfatase n=1 Tax=Allotamlana fucoidanivorans TaxID=2583814 RepID=A0A5C4SDD0_9FLAO|nr:sulfatase [Tamlana fucoidanivorans]TNJ41496.1 sulfatase [Tamlana fucoidanivorans]
MKIYGIVLSSLLLVVFSCNHRNRTKKTSEVATTLPLKPNIVFILADDLGFTDLGFTGSDLYQTPNIDQLAKDGMYFPVAHSSHPTCQPSRISLMTGKTPGRLKAISHGSLGGVEGPGIEIPAEEVTLGEALQKGGYTTAHIGKWHIGQGDNQPKYRGFNVDIASNDFCCPGSYFYPYSSVSKNPNKDKLAAIPDLEGYNQGTHLTEALSNEAVKFISAQKNSDKPFYLNLWYYAVHTPIQSEKEKIKKYKALITPNTRHNHAAYAGLVEHLDDGVGRVLKALEENGLSENTVVIFMGDNGGELRNGITDNTPLRGGKGMFYEGGTRTPMFVKWPNVVKPGSVCNERVVGWDIYPTVLSIANIEGDANHNKNVDGEDLTPLLNNPKNTLEPREFNWLKYVAMVHYNSKLTERNWPGGSIIKDDWKLIEYFEMPVANVTHHFKLFNLKEDPSEKNNLVDSMPKKVNALKKAMQNWRKEIGADDYSMESFYGHLN